MPWKNQIQLSLQLLQESNSNNCYKEQNSHSVNSQLVYIYLEFIL